MSDEEYSDTASVSEEHVQEHRRVPPRDESLGVWCHSLEPQLADHIVAILKEQGFHHTEGLASFKRSFPTRASWLEFARRVSIPEKFTQLAAFTFGPNIPPASLHMDKQDRLRAELVAWYDGDFDNKDSHPDDQRHRLRFLLHDTSKDNADRILSMGLMVAANANDTHYDGRLASGTAPRVVFFQASELGVDGSIYPRGCRGDAKRRFSVKPSHLALHTESFRMYFVKISQPRDSDSRSVDGMFQLHVLFISQDHPKTGYCDEHFLMLNKRNFQPYNYSPETKHWHGFRDCTTKAFRGRGVKLNIAVAQDIPMWYGEQQTQRSISMREVFDKGFGVTEPPPDNKKVCIHWVKGSCTAQPCDYLHLELQQAVPMHLQASPPATPIQTGNSDIGQDLVTFIQNYGLQQMEVEANPSRTTGLRIKAFPSHVYQNHPGVIEDMFNVMGVRLQGFPGWKNPVDDRLRPGQQIRIVMITLDEGVARDEVIRHLQMALQRAN